ncbi:MAG: DUF4238 domain-containing protein [Candidatus Binatia bacterium]
MKKRRHHYVWQHYLKAWTTGGTIACLRDGRLFRSSTSNLAVETDFYRLKELTDSDLRLIEEVCIKRCLPELRSLQAGWISIFTSIFDLKRRYEAVVGHLPDAVRAFDDAISNLEEDLHSQIESESIPQLQALRNRDLTFLASEDEFAGFLHFLCVQYLRTNKVRSDALEAVRGVPGVEAERAWGVMAHIFATNISYRLFTSRDRLRITILQASEGGELVTSDQPVINMHAVGLPLGTQVDELAFYYPVSPTTGLLLEAEKPEGGTHRRVLNPREVNDSNHAMFQQAHTQVFACSEELLAAFGGWR